MLSQLTQSAKNLWTQLSNAANQLFRRITEPARSNRVTGTLADLPWRRTELLAKTALLRQQLTGLHRQVKTPRLTWHDRLSLLSRRAWRVGFRIGSSSCRSASRIPSYAGIARPIAFCGGSNRAGRNPQSA